MMSYFLKVWLYLVSDGGISVCNGLALNSVWEMICTDTVVYFCS